MKTVLITGGSSGIGFEISKHFAQNNYRLLWVSKPVEELESAKTKLLAIHPNVELICFAKDLTGKNAPYEVHEWVTKNDWTIDVLINNAGFGTYGFNNDIAIEKEVNMIQLNVLGVYKMTRYFLKEMIKRDQGTIINISSISAMQPVARMNTYASTKAFVKHFSMGLQEELLLQKSKVKVQVVCPAAITDTPFKVTGEMADVKTFEGLAYTTAAEVAKDVWNGFQNKKGLIITGAKMKWIYRFQGLMPYAFKQYLVRRESERK